MWLDGRPVGEIGLAQATAAALGVPVVALTEDDAACEEAVAWDGSIATVAVKYARGRFAAELRPEAEARRAIEEAVIAALTAPREPVPASPRTSTLTVRWQLASVPATLLGIPGVTATDSRTVRAEGELPALYRLFGVWMRVASSLTDQPPYC